MEGHAFRGDSYLRASAYHLFGWALVGIAATVPVGAARAAEPTLLSSLTAWAGPYYAAVSAVGLAWSFVAERRALKIAGRATVARRPGVARTCLAALVLAAAATVVLAAVAEKYVAAVWLAAGGVIVLRLGWGLLPAYVVLGTALLAGAVATLAIAAAAEGPRTPAAVVHVVNGLLGLTVIPCAWLVNCRYLWH